MSDELEGIDPRDLPAASEAGYSPEELSRIANEVVGTHPTGVEDPIELHDSEIPKAMALLMYLQEKYSQRWDTSGNLESLRKEAEEKFAKIGLQVLVDFILPDEPPTITVVGRTTPFDPDRQRFDVKSGVADPYWDAKRQQR